MTALQDSRNASDVRWMKRALELARRGIALTSPNPSVGCVILDRGGNLAGEGWHEYDRRDHAEVVALRFAGERAKGGTAYVTLEPCNHTGRTGPCSVALIEAGIARVVVATSDPNPLVSGTGLRRLQEAGVAVTVGVESAPAQALNEGFARWIQDRRPFVHMKVAMSLDGRIGPTPKDRTPSQPFWITGEAAREEVQQMRWQADALITGIGTVLSDDPLLTDRSGRARRRPLLRVVLDSQLRIPERSKLVASAADDLLIFTLSNDAEKRARLEKLGVRVEVVDRASDGHVPLAAVMQQLGRQEILTLLTETGSRLNAALLETNLIDRLSLFTAPQLLGEDSTPAFSHLQAPLAFHNPEITWFGSDCRWSSLLLDPWRS